MSDAPRRSPFALFRDPEFCALASARFVRGMSFATIIIALALYADRYAATGVVAGLFGTAYALARLVLVLPVGRAIDLGDGKRYLLAGLAVNAVLLVGYAGVGAIEHVVALRALQGGGSALLIVTTTTVIGEIAPADERGLWIGTSGQVKSVASLAGDLGGGGLLYAVGFRFAFSFGKMAVIIFLPIFARTTFGMSSFAIGGILAGGRVTKALAQGYLGSVGDRSGDRSRFVLAGAGLCAIGTALTPFATGAAALFAVPTLAIAGAAVGPFAVGAVLDAASFLAAFWLGAVVVLVAGGVFATIHATETASVPATDPGT